MLIFWWAMTDLNRRPSRCKRDALPAELIARIDSCEPPSRSKRRDAPSNVEFVAQALAGLELRLFRRGDLYLFPGSRIAPFGSSTLCDREGTKADETDLTSGLER